MHLVIDGLGRYEITLTRHIKKKKGHRENKTWKNKTINRTIFGQLE